LEATSFSLYLVPMEKKKYMFDSTLRIEASVKD
jgi:hypothetical protein